MPLPDERPRASVANLIGRFELQNKRQSFPAAPRSTSVASHTTGDSAKEEAKEKREWPPKSLASNGNAPPQIIPSSSWTRSTHSATQPASPPTNTVETALPQAPPNDPTPYSTPAVASPPAAIPMASPPQGQRRLDDTPALKSDIASPSAIPTSPVRTPAVKAPDVTHSKASVKTTKAPPKANLTSSNSQPLKPQHTGQSTTSASTARKPTPRTVPNTPARPKTPSRASISTPHPKTPSRPKTPASRPKTPSGLFAPTAASLARARNAPEQRPTPTKKATLSASAADRLSKPTAASMSKARSPVPVPPSPARGGAKTPAPRGDAARGSVKPKVGLTRATQEKEKVAQKAAGTQKVVAKAAAGVAVGAVASADLPESEDIPDEEDASHHDTLELDASGYADNADLNLQEEGASPEIFEEEVHEEAAVASEPETRDVELQEEELPQGGDINIEVETLLPHRSPNASSPPLDLQPEESEVDTERPHSETELGSEPHNDIGEPQPNPELVELTDEGKSRLPVGSDIEDMVNLLELKPNTKARPLSIISIPDEEVQEIPDEE